MKITFIILLARQLALLQENATCAAFRTSSSPRRTRGAMFLFTISSPGRGQRPCVSVRLCVHGVCGRALRCAGSSSALAARWADSLLRGISIFCAATGTTASRSSWDHSYQPEKGLSADARNARLLGSGKLTGQGCSKARRRSRCTGRAFPSGRQTSSSASAARNWVSSAVFIIIGCCWPSSSAASLSRARSADAHGEPCVRRHGGHAHFPDDRKHRHVLISYAGHRTDAAVFQLRRLVDRDAVRCDGGCVGHQEAVKAGVAHN